MPVIHPPVHRYKSSVQPLCPDALVQAINQRYRGLFIRGPVVPLMMPLLQTPVPLMRTSNLLCTDGHYPFERGC